MKRSTAKARLTAFKEAWNGRVGQLLRVLFAVLPCWWIVQNVDIRGVARSAVSLGLINIIIVLTVAVLGYAVASVRWWTLIKAYGGDRPPRVSTLLRHYLVGAYYGILPSGLANDVLRGFRVREHLPGIGASYTVVLVERVSGLMALMCIAMVAMVASPWIDRSIVSRALDFGLAGAFAFSAVFLLFPYIVSKRERWRELVGSIPLVGKLATSIPPARSIWALLLGLVFSLGTQLLAILTVYLIGRSIIPTAGLMVYARVVPFVMLLTAIPLTPMALGQRELLSVYFFGLAGISPEQSVAISLLTFGVSIEICGIGGLCHLVERLAGWEKRPEEPDTGDQP